jgi:hypothetical protein
MGYGPWALREKEYLINAIQYYAHSGGIHLIPDSQFAIPQTIVSSNGYAGCHYDFDSKEDYPQCYITINEFNNGRLFEKKPYMNRHP